MKPVRISHTQARRLALAAQGLHRREPFGRGKAGVLRTIEHLGYVQIDTISVVERAHHHVLWSRIPDYRPELLHELQADRSVFEYWSHAASYLPMRDFRFALPRMEAYARGKSHWFKQDARLMRRVLDRIRAEGPLQARDFEPAPGIRSGPWYDWKPSKRALEQLFMAGKLMVRERRGFQKVYDLTERVLPSGIDVSMPDSRETARHLIGKALQAHGLVTAVEIAYLRRGMLGPVRSALSELAEEGELMPVSGFGDSARDRYFCRPVDLEEASKARRVSERVEVLSPFDNLVIQRKRLKAFFGFDYQIECYVPAPKRKYGYFCLPLLSGECLVGRVDAKADRAGGVLEIRSLYLEPEGRPARRLRQIPEEFKEALERFAAFNACDAIKAPGRGRKKGSG